MAGLLKSAGAASAAGTSAAIMASRLTGLLRESVLSWLFGAGATYDAYVLGFRIPSLARELFAEGALSSAFVPTFSRSLATKTHAETQELSNVTGTLILTVVGAFCAFGMLLSPVFVAAFAPGYASVPGKSELAGTLVRIMFPFLLLLSLAAQAQGILYANRRFALPAVSPAIFNLASVAGGLALGRWTPLGAARGMAFGVVLGGIVQLAFLLPGVWRAGFAWRPRWNLRHEGVRHILTLMGPALIGNASGQINVLVNTNLAAGLRDASGHAMNGPVSWLAYAYRFFVLPLGIFGVAVASAALPRLSHSAAVRDMREFRETLSRSIMTILLLTIPAAVGLAVLGESMIGIVYQHGRFLAADTRQTALALTCYAVGLAGYSLLKLIAPAFYALGDAKTPMYVSLASVLVNLIAALLLVRVAHFGHAGLALSVSAVSTFSVLALLAMLRLRIGGLQGRELLSGGAKILLAALLMGVLCEGVVAASHALLPNPLLARMADVAVGIPAGMAAFAWIAGLLRVPGLAEARAGLLARFVKIRSSHAS